jgi:hypothetical protein
VKLEDFSLSQIAVGVLVLGLLNWAALQFVALPDMPEEQRKRLYSGWASTPYPYAIGLAFIAFAVWFVFYYQGRFATPRRRIAVFTIAFGALCGMVMVLIVRTVWHI